MGGLARARSLSAGRRSNIARQAAEARWSLREDGIVPLCQIRKAARMALEGRRAKAYLFGSYARGKATPHSDIDIMVIESEPPESWLEENSELRHRMHEHMGWEKELDLIVIDEFSFMRWKDEYGSVQHEVSREGVRLV